MKFYILADGPDDTTPDFACNIWGMFTHLYQSLFAHLHLEKINQEFPYFSELHKLFGGRGNVVPVAVTTGVGPNGAQTIFYQRPDEHPELRPAPVIDPVLLALELSPEPQTPAEVPQTPAGVRPTPAVDSTNARRPKASTASRLAHEKAAAIHVVPQKRSVAESLLDISRYVSYLHISM